MMHLESFDGGRTSIVIPSCEEWLLSGKVVADEEFLSSIQQMREVEVAGANAMRRSRRGDESFCVEDEEEEERRKSELSVLNGSESEASKSASKKSRRACDTSSVILSLSSSTPSSSSRSSKTFFRDPKDESKMTAKGKKYSK
ncbi:uncharacterized protein MONOS_13567 [Monocercomonoides exilis]|uniref:uncharacterized protein n=1 Tax=Monocercomonoides exilis TaxID=2049356 RepID=UPI0035599D06|nr:hypothetical protein MONOS_13567 [Monocercomonoides exilis]|eukprot:MONOS_13567.1-p1 / transcript=MONOS_13567.1 / gene=MONOS_13567 / organism=Monocercomonoides_exilis_PA203 / gene_product=unspecified product / transcript_product=unspecified product / location=Mono_scaffold00846:14150-14578(-) / protein_length=143 / sequence_SO=supercontig / SO=protein_coding / is_pseudo=false